MYPGYPIKIVDFKQSREKVSIEFNEKELESILKHPDVVNRKVVVVSIIGALRQGKSFMLALFLRFLYTTVRVNSYLMNNYFYFSLSNFYIKKNLNK